MRLPFSAVNSLLVFMLGIYILLSPTYTLAAEVSHVNVGRVVIEDQSVNAQQRAGREALAQVFVKLSGAESVLDDPIIKRAINNFEQYLISSSYLQINDKRYFEARFNQEQLVGLIRGSNLPIWPSIRPSASLWLAIQTPSKDIEWLNQNNATEFNQKLQQTAFESGVNVLLPLGDLNDAMAISDFDVFTQNSPKLLQQNSRYGTEFIISAAVKPISVNMREEYEQQAQFSEQQAQLNALLNQPNGLPSSNAQPSSDAALERHFPAPSDNFQMDLIFSNGTQIEIRKRFFENEDNIAETVIDEYVSWLVAQYAVDTSSNASVASQLITINNVRSFVDASRALQALSNAPQVNSASIVGLNGSSVQVKVSLNGSVEGLLSVLKLDKRLSSPLDGTMAENASVADSTKTQEIVFRWMP
uniref:DUF2066 domain-containing protein n=1 Tax=Ningiella ruwaisensis TaxID=2364274 RepID=UPI00109FA62C|nr:DUF2066 domain-containing protein [Ningiella ruwaisensis]